MAGKKGSTIGVDRTDDRPVYIVGGGPGGLATAAALRARGVRAVVLERSDAVGASWRGHYDRLRLHTTRRLSGLPGLPLPRSCGRWVSRDDLVRYLESYADHHELEIVTGVSVSRIDRAEGGDWTLHATGGRLLTGRAVVVATGRCHTAHLPAWPGREDYPGELLHSRAYRSPAPYAGREVLVVGSGNSAAEIAVDLVEGGAARVGLAVRTPPHIVRRSVAGWPAQRTGVLVRRMPVRLLDAAAGLRGPLGTPDLSEHGLPRPGTPLGTRMRQGAAPVVDTGLVAAVRTGRIEVMAPVASFEGAKAVLADGTRIAPDAVIAATGYRSGLEQLVGHLGVLDEAGLPLAHGRRGIPKAPGLYFTGFTTPISGMLRELSLDAGRLARAVAARH
ncbi:flavin-containing monooxygenase [Streptomyces sp. NPDC047999]|uniref:flavin-containing monooxygenase n=1 Tax=Streptomyces sp. NPDC047999 TaxID=3365497 RepID=UPI003722F0F4